MESEEDSDDQKKLIGKLKMAPKPGEQSFSSDRVDSKIDKVSSSSRGSWIAKLKTPKEGEEEEEEDELEPNVPLRVRSFSHIYF